MPRESSLHCVYLLSQLAVYTLSLSHSHTQTHTKAFQQTYKYGHKHVITTMHGPLRPQFLTPRWHTHGRRSDGAEGARNGHVVSVRTYSTWEHKTERKKTEWISFLGQVSFQEIQLGWFSSVTVKCHESKNKKAVYSTAKFREEIQTTDFSLFFNDTVVFNKSFWQPQVIYISINLEDSQDKNFSSSWP